MFTFQIPPALLAGLNAVEANEGISKSEQARRAIQQWLQERPALVVPRSPKGKQKRAR